MIFNSLEAWFMADEESDDKLADLLKRITERAEASRRERLQEQLDRPERADRTLRIVGRDHD